MKGVRSAEVQPRSRVDVYKWGCRFGRVRKVKKVGSSGRFRMV